MMDLLVDCVESIFERLINGTDSVKLGVMRAHDRTVIADKLLAAVAEVTEGLLVKHTVLLPVKRAISLHSA